MGRWRSHRQVAKHGCTENNPTGFTGADQLTLLAARRASPENTVAKVRLSTVAMDANHRHKLYVFEFRWWQGDLTNKPARTRA